MPRVRLCFALLIGASLLALSRPARCIPATNWMWIWASDTPRSQETLFFRQRFQLTQAPRAARLLITADETFSAYLNARKTPVAQGRDWRTVQEFDVTRALHAGANLLAVEVFNASGHGGLLYKLVITAPGGKTRTLFSDARVRVTRRAPPVWTTPALDDSRWAPAKEIAPANGGPWGPLRGTPVPDPTRLVRLWNIRANNDADESPYARSRDIGDRMLLSASVSSPSDMRILAGAGFTLFQTDSDHLSTEQTAPNQWDWRAPDAARQTVQALGLDWCYFPHYAFPPPWYRQSSSFTRIQCLEHHLPVQAFSIWDPTWPHFIDQGYAALAQEFGPRKPDKNVRLDKIAKPDKNALPDKNGNLDKNAKGAAPARHGHLSAAVVGVHGDYGEAGLLNGARVAAPAQREDWLRRFGNTHDHLGWWCDDKFARADFRAAMLAKYGDLSRLNAAWKRAYATPEEINYPDKPRTEARREWLDFVAWYYASVGKAIDANLDAARKHFPEALLMLPAGFGDEDLRGGNDNSLIPKLAARYKADVRSTHAAFKPFAENAATMLGRLGSASRFYGAPFWTEPPGALTPDEEVERIFEAVSQGAVGLFDWASAAVANRDVYYRYGKFLRVEKPVVDVAMLYPSTSMRLRPELSYAPLFAQAGAYLREHMNFDIVDDRMIQDGCLPSYRVLVMWEGDINEQSTLDKIRAWVNDGGVLLAYDFGKIKSVEGDLSWFQDMFGYVRDLQPAKATDKYVGKIPEQYRISVGQPEASDYLNGEIGWYDPEKEGDLMRRWTGATATIRLPVDPDKHYNLIVRASIPAQAVSLKHTLLLNGQEIGHLDGAGDVTYRFPVPDGMLEDHPLSTLTFKSETFQPSKLLPDSKDERNLGVFVTYAQLVEQGANETPDVSLPPGALRREFDMRRLNTDWARRYGKGLTVYYPASRRLLRGYMEVVRRVTYNLSEIFPDHRDALPISMDEAGVYATLFTDKILYYNSTDNTVAKTVSIPASAFAAWRGEVSTPTETSWKMTLEPHSIGAIYLAPPPQELLFECEKFTEMGSLKPLESPDCSPGKGATCVRIPGGQSISTRFLIETPGHYACYVRSVRRNRLEPVEVLIDGQPVVSLNKKSGQTYLINTVSLMHGAHTLTLRALPKREVRADFVLLTNDPTISGYAFAIRTPPVE